MGRRKSNTPHNCLRCGNPFEGYCRPCHAAHMREHRAQHGQTAPTQKLKDAARNKARVYLRLGYITRKPCERCGSDLAQMHHEDYSKALDVTWLCRPCHIERHKEIQQETAKKTEQELDQMFEHAIQAN